jgi:hypothetical protein
MTTHEARAAKITKTLRTVPYWIWTAVKIAYVGTVYVNRMTTEQCTAFGYNEFWVRVGGMNLGNLGTIELRGSAEAVAKQLCMRLRPPSKAVAQAVQVIMNARSKINPGGAGGIYLLHAPEAAAWLGLSEDTAYRAFRYLEEIGYGTVTECGWRYAA